MKARRAIWKLHHLLGLGVGALITLMSVTGGTLVLHGEIERLVSPERHVVAIPTGDATRAPLSTIVTQVAAEAPAGYRPLRLERGHGADESDKLVFVAPDGRTRWSAFVNPYTGAVLWRGDDQALFTSWLLNLHMHLRAGGWGYVVTATAGASLLLLGITGVIVHRARFADLFRRPMRFDRGWRGAFGDLHRWVGLASIYFCVVLGLTGMIYAVKSAPKQFAAPKPAPAAFDLARLAPIEPALALAQQRFADAEIFRIGFPASGNAPLIVMVLHRDAPVWRKFSRLEFDAASGALRAVRDAREATLADKFSAMLGPLHFGLYGSPLVHVLYALGGFTPALLALSGFAIWLLRSRKAAVSEPALAPEPATVSQT